MQPNQTNPGYPPAPPQQPVPQPPQPQQQPANPYGFSSWTTTVPKKSSGLLGLFNGGSKKVTHHKQSRLELSFLLIAGWMLMSLLTAGNAAQNEKITGA
jgi:hypothetical protein